MHARRIVASLAAILLLTLVVPADADVDPLVVIKRQIRKPNMLIVFDTSGSLTGVPGGAFTGATEVGVDCDQGINCRDAGGTKCKISGLPCTNDSECATGRCQSDGSACRVNADCSTRCTLTGNVCRSNADCSADYGKCKFTGAVCSVAANNCAAIGKCAAGSRTCTNFGADCNYGTCAADPAKECGSEWDCPRAANGTCEATGIACVDNGPCPPTAGKCQIGGQQCWSDTCGNTKGTCSIGGAACDHSGQCVGQCAKGGAACWGDGECGEQGPCNRGTCNGMGINDCVGWVNNWCDKFPTVCNKLAGNTCVQQVNTCTGGNTCVATGAADVCLSNTLDRCEALPQGLKAVWYDNHDLTGKTVERIDAVVDFDHYNDGWNDLPPGISRGHSVVWTGVIKIPTAGNWQFRTFNDDGVRLWLDNQLVIDDWTGHGGMHMYAPTKWYPAGKNLPVRLEYYNEGGGGVISLEWWSDTKPWQVIPTQNLLPAYPRMCRVAQNVCYADSDCTAIPGDSCGPPTSRAVIAKRAVSRLIAGNWNVVNLGLMTFYQGGYFPYYALNDSIGQTEKFFFTKEMLTVNDCWTANTGPTAKCTIAGALYDLGTSPNSRYTVTDGVYKLTYDQDWCGSALCATTGGTGAYSGSFYTRFQQTPGNVGAVVNPPRATYAGKTIAGAPPLRYFTPRPDYYNAGVTPPFSIANCGAACSATCGARWDLGLSDPIEPGADEATLKKNAAKMMGWMAQAGLGGLMTHGETPSGCTLMNDVAGSVNTSAYHYMDALLKRDTVDCRANFVLFITDGEANGPGDVGCADAACSDPNNLGACQCKAVKSAAALRALGVRTFVVGFASDATAGAGAKINDNIARAGGTDSGNDGIAPYAFGANNEDDLNRVLQQAIYDAVKGSYSTTPSTTSSGTQETNALGTAKYIMDARVDFPSWNGHLIAYDITKSPPMPAWDAAEQLKLMPWWERRIFLGGKDKAVTQLLIDPNTKLLVNKKAVADALQLPVAPEMSDATREAEADRIARFTMGDPAMKNPIVMGAVIGSTPIDVASPGNDILRPGAQAFYTTYKDRIPLTYFGASDGMLHAVFTNGATVGGKVFPAGREAFAYAPRDMVNVLKKLYTQRGQLADPDQHVFGIAASPKAKNMCVERCSQGDARWRTVLVVGEGRGGNNLFALDVTQPVTTAGFAPLVTLDSVGWHSDDTLPSTSIDNGPTLTQDLALGMTYSVPGFFYRKDDTKGDYRLITASGYRWDADKDKQGRTIAVISARTGQVLESPTVALKPACPIQKHAILADVATARDYGIYEEGRLLSAYVGDTWGTLWRYNPATKAVAALTDFGCDRPLHFAPTVIQLDRDDPAVASKQVYLVQVTNSALDDDTVDNPTPSQLVIMKEQADGMGGFVVDAGFGVGGKLTLTVGDPTFCGVTGVNGACLKPIPAKARPTATPAAILKRDGSGFLLLSSWYVPDTVGCTKGETYLALHEVLGQNVSQKQGLLIANEPVTSPVFVGGKIFVITTNEAKEFSTSLNVSFSLGAATLTPASGGKQFVITNWTEDP